MIQLWTIVLCGKNLKKEEEEEKQDKKGRGKRNVWPQIFINQYDNSMEHLDKHHIWKKKIKSMKVKKSLLKIWS